MVLRFPVSSRNAILHPLQELIRRQCPATLPSYVPASDPRSPVPWRSVCRRFQQSHGHPRDDLLPTAGTRCPRLPTAQGCPSGPAPPSPTAGAVLPAAGRGGGGRSAAGGRSLPARPQPVCAERRHSRARRGAGGAGRQALPAAGQAAGHMACLMAAFSLGTALVRGALPSLPPSEGPRRGAGGGRCATGAGEVRG